MTDATVKDICQAWAQAGYGDECFWEHWAECPTEETLTPNMLLACIEAQAAEIERLRGDLKRAVEERDEALNQLDSARHSVDVLEKRVSKLMGANP
jgi:hypothetical protein